ncbi:MAG: hypothetical protein ACC645_23260 [Pirellulales bacterium]
MIDPDIANVAVIGYESYAGMIVSCPPSYRGGTVKVWVSSLAEGDGWTDIVDITLVPGAATVLSTAVFAAHRIKLVGPAGLIFFHLKG